MSKKKLEKNSPVKVDWEAYRKWAGEAERSKHTEYVT